MAELKKFSDREADVTVFQIKGELSGEDLLALTEQFYAEQPTTLLLLDVRLASVSRVTVEDCLDNIKLALSHRPQRLHGKTAVLVGDTMQYGMARMYEMLSASRDQIEIAVFNSLVDACIWLSSEPFTPPLSQAVEEATPS